MNERKMGSTHIATIDAMPNEQRFAFVTNLEAANNGDLDNVGLSIGLYLVQKSGGLTFEGTLDNLIDHEDVGYDEVHDFVLAVCDDEGNEVEVHRFTK